MTHPQLGLYPPGVSSGAVLSFDGMSEEERAVARVLPIGRANARQVRDLATAVNLPPRRVQQILKGLLEKYGWPIGTAMERPFGNYVAEGTEERERAAMLLTAHAVSTLKRAAALRGIPLGEQVADVQEHVNAGESDQ